MTKQNCLELDFSWKDTESSEYLEALSLPTLPWAAPFLSLLGLPNALLEQPSKELFGLPIFRQIPVSIREKFLHPPS